MYLTHWSQTHKGRTRDDDGNLVIAASTLEEVFKCLRASFSTHFRVANDNNPWAHPTVTDFVEGYKRDAAERGVKVRSEIHCQCVTAQVLILGRGSARVQG